MAAPATLIKSNKCFGGWQHKFEHQSTACACRMTFSVFLPSEVVTATRSDASAVPVLYYLSGLTCTDDNVVQKSVRSC